MFLQIPQDNIVGKPIDKVYLTEGARMLLQDGWYSDIHTTIRETTVDFGHGPVIVREHRHGCNVPLTNRFIVA